MRQKVEADFMRLWGGQTQDELRHKLQTEKSQQCVRVCVCVAQASQFALIKKNLDGILKGCCRLKQDHMKIDALVLLQLNACVGCVCTETDR